MPQVELSLRRIVLFFLLCLLPAGLNAHSAPAAEPLAHSSSPYLAQHSHTPVHWYPWGQEPLTRAKQEQKLLFLTIGATTCQQCRLLEQETFLDHATSSLLNNHFVSILVDRDEHPDLDHYFRMILTAMTGKAAWPLHMVLTPDLQPIYGGSYFPLNGNSEHPSLHTLLTTLLNTWQTDRPTLLTRLSKLSAWLAEQQTLPQPDQTNEEYDPRPDAANFWRQRLDPQYGSLIGQEQQAPQPLLLSLLLRQAARQKQPGDALPALLALDKMASSGLRDHLAGAFFRLSRDARWQTPLFDILLPDNALLARSYLEAFQLTGKRDYAQVAQEILQDLLQRLQLSGGCFAASLSSDSHSANRYYTWSAEEIHTLLGPQADSFLELTFDPVDSVISGRSVLRLLAGLQTMHNNPEEWQEQRRLLLAARAQRPALFRDEKIVTSWNALTISVLARAATLLQQDQFLAAARNCLTNLQQAFPTPDSLRHSRWGNQHSSTIFLDDYAFLAQAMLDLYEAEFSPSLLDQADALLQEINKRFHTDHSPLFTLTPQPTDSPLPQQTLWEDAHYPSGLAVALISMQRLALFQQGGKWESVLAKIEPHLLSLLKPLPQAAPELLRRWDYLPQSALEVVVVGERSHPDTQLFLKEIRQHLLPGLALVHLEPDLKSSPSAWPLLAPRPMLNGKPTVYVCRQQFCRMPVNRLSDLLRELDHSHLSPPLLLPTP
ncbi:thioredoxin domain-containing protein [Candidatus Magnetaquicoccus inordinatus]|uniref:thioredoxin domain-containing protein n=1 Tax=Candidatus Magnetaquicoccus inordinatus TaxID=2496818 RepID=UPI00102B33BD|nr:DUF255 domain-containing protein [Candidatus Magnetaquicoccus inordinatus]